MGFDSLRGRMDLDVHELKQLETDARGRAYLGSDYAKQDVRIAILSEPTDE